MRRLGETALRDVAQQLSGRRGERDHRRAGAAGELTGATRPWQFGDTEPWNISRTLTNAVLRQAGTATLDGPDARLKISVDDVEVSETETRTQAAVALLVDTSFSMVMENRWLPMKQTALALNHLVCTRFRSDALQIIAFGRYARTVTAAELTGLEGVYEQGTNLHHALALAGRHLRRHPNAQPVVLVVTDGEPTAHLEDFDGDGDGLLRLPAAPADHRPPCAASTKWRASARKSRSSGWAAIPAWRGSSTRSPGASRDASWCPISTGWGGGRRRLPTIPPPSIDHKRRKPVSKVPTIELNDGVEIPQLGFGVFQIKPDETASAVKTALDIGYRHIDTAEMYGNEKEVRQGIRDAGLERGEVFITSKLNNGFHKPDDARRAFDQTLKALDSDYVDLFLIHWPLPTLYDGDFVSTWKVFEEFARDGRARSIGVSNFQVAHLNRLADETDTVPSVNQIEVHPYFGNDEVRAYGREHGIATEAWAPIAQGKVLDDPVINRIAGSRDKTPAQVVLRWHIQRGDIVFPKSVTPARVKSNFELFDFELDDSDMDAISALNKGESGRNGPNPDTFDYVPR